MTDFPNFSLIFKEKLQNLKDTQEFRESGYIRIEHELIADIDILKLVSSYDIPEQQYFKNKNGINQFGGLSSSYIITANKPKNAFKEINRILSINKNIRLFGGFCFSCKSELTDEWENFSNCRFTLPFIEIHKKNGKYLIIVNYYNEEKPPIDAAKNEITGKLNEIDSRAGLNKIILKFQKENEVSFPEKEDWNNMINNALHMIDQKEIDKVVLSRKKIITNKYNWDLYAILNKLNKLEEESFLFYYKINEDQVFLGRSPERLFKLKKNILTAESIAGTRPRSADPEKDRELGDELLNSPKELEEHRIVSRFIKEKMDKFCSDVSVDRIEDILKLQNVQHIITRYSGSLNNGVNISEIIESFHPSPAVGGHPNNIVLDVIPKLEPFQRGWYAAPIGWIRQNEANFAVGIRSALINDKNLHIFAGAGIVKQSNPNDEWDETSNKMDNYLKGLGSI